MTERGCGGCTLCCRFFAVPEIRKPEGTWCRHCTATGCGIHPTRPQSCRNFECFWLMDAGFPEEMRPDRSGLVVSWNGANHESAIVQVDPERPGALEEPLGAQLLQALLRRFDPVFVVRGEERIMLRRKDPRRTATAPSKP